MRTSAKHAHLNNCMWYNWVPTNMAEHMVDRGDAVVHYHPGVGGPPALLCTCILVITQIHCDCITCRVMLGVACTLCNWQVGLAACCGSSTACTMFTN